MISTTFGVYRVSGKKGVKAARCESTLQGPYYVSGYRFDGR